MFGYMFTYSLVSTYLMSLQFMIENLCIINSKSVKAVTVFSAPDEKCLHTVASSWTFLLTLIHDARNHEFKIHARRLRKKYFHRSHYCAKS